MKKNFLFFSLCIVMILGVNACSNNKGAENVSSERDAGEIIAYTNDLIDYLNATGDWTRSNDRRFEDMVKFVKNKKKPTAFLPLHSNVSLSVREDKYNLTNPPAVMSEEEKTYFRGKMQAYKATYDGLVNDAQTLYDYLKNEDYKDDSYAKGQELVEKIQEALETLSFDKSELYGKIDVVTEKAEEIILQDHPLRDPILTLKQELKAFSELEDIFDDYDEGEATADQVDAAYQALAERVEKNKGLYTSTLDEQNKQSNYDRFYKDCDTALASYRKALREVKAGKKLKDSHFKDFSSDYNRLINSYNSFVS